MYRENNKSDKTISDKYCTNINVSSHCFEFLSFSLAILLLCVLTPEISGLLYTVHAVH